MVNPVVVPASIVPSMAGTGVGNANDTAQTDTTIIFANLFQTQISAQEILLADPALAPIDGAKDPADQARPIGSPDGQDISTWLVATSTIPIEAMPLRVSNEVAPDAPQSARPLGEAGSLSNSPSHTDHLLNLIDWTRNSSATQLTISPATPDDAADAGVAATTLPAAAPASFRQAMVSPRIERGSASVARAAPTLNSAESPATGFFVEPSNPTNAPAGHVQTGEGASLAPEALTVGSQTSQKESKTGEISGPASFAGSTDGKLPVATETSTASPAPTLAHDGIRPATHSLAATDASPAASPHIDTPFGDARWNTDFSQRIVLLARQDVQSAQMTLNPPELGPIDVTLNLSRDQASAVFSSPNAEVREALESALPRLREMLAGAGISLGQTHVNSQSPQQNWEQGYRPYDESRNSTARPTLAGESGTTLPLPRMRSGIGLIDTFA